MPDGVYVCDVGSYVSALRCEVVGSLKRQGWTIGSGYGALKDSTIRIGHMGDHTLAALEELLALIERALS